MKADKAAPWIRMVLLLCALALIAVIFIPMWRIELSAPQYPEGLVMLIYPGKLGGNIDITHDEIEMQYVISPIIQACDAISGARPGARREIMQQYIQRIKDLENLAMAYNGVEKAYAIQAGRELRVIVEADKVTDSDSDKLSFEIAQKIQTEMTFPGQIKVTVIREKRSVNVAR